MPAARYALRGKGDLCHIEGEAKRDHIELPKAAYRIAQCAIYRIKETISWIKERMNFEK